MKTQKLMWLTAVLVLPLVFLATSPNSKNLKGIDLTQGDASTLKQKETVETLQLPVYDPNKPFVKPSDDALYKALPIESFAVTQRCGTETPFKNAYWNNEQEGIYVDIVSGEPLFSSTNKYDSGSGWPSFWKPIDSNAITLVNTDGSIDFGFEVRSKKADSHLGHVFTDGPEPSGLRFCINSAALKFIPKEDMEKMGYKDFLYLFK